MIALYTSDKKALLLTDLAAMLLGAISLPLNDRFTAPEMEYYLQDSTATLALTDDAGRETVAAADVYKRQPLGCPVVPDEYSMKAGAEDAMGISGKAEMCIRDSHG